MNVFPAFDENYKKRKRRFACCRTCRYKRVKCIINTPNYEILGCQNCQDANIKCDFIQAQESDTKPQVTDKPKAGGAAPATDTPGQAYAFVPANYTYPTPQSQQMPPQIPPRGQGMPPVDYQGLYRYPHPVLVNPNFPARDGNTVVPEQLPQHYSIPQYSSSSAPLPSFQLGQSLLPLYPPGYYLPPSQQPYFHPVSLPLPPHMARTTPSLSPGQTLTGPAPEQLTPEQAARGQSATGQPTPVPSSTGQPTPGQPTSGDSTTRQSTSGQSVSGEPKDLLKLNQVATAHQPSLSILPTLPQATVERPERLTPAYLKGKFGFNLRLLEPSYSMLKIPMRGELQENSNLFKRVDLEPEEAFVDDADLIQFLLAKDAFTLADKAFPISKEQEKSFIDIYFKRINSIFPIINEEEFREKYNKGEESTLLKYAIVIAILRDDECHPILHELYGSKYRDELPKVIKRIDMKIRQIILILPDLKDNDMLNTLAVHILLSLNYNSHKYGNEMSGEDLYSAVSMAFSLMIHRKILQDEDKTYTQNRTKLWWVIYIFDIFNAITNSKGFIIKEADCDVEYPEDEDFTELIKVAQTTKEVILLIYQPTAHNLTALKQYEELVTSEIRSNTEVDSNRALIMKFLKILVVFMINNVHIRMKGTYYNINDVYLQICANMLNGLTTVQRRSPLINIPVIPGLTSFALSVILKYKMKIIYLSKLGKIGERTDIDSRKIALIDATFKGLLEHLKRLDTWWFIKQILDNVNLIFDRKKRRQSQADNNKQRTAGSISREKELLPQITSITSPTYYKDGIVTGEFLSDMQLKSESEEDAEDVSEDLVDVKNDYEQAPEEASGEAGEAVVGTSKHPVEHMILLIEGNLDQYTTPITLNDEMPLPEMLTDIFNEAESSDFLKAMDSTYAGKDDFHLFVKDDPTLKQFFSL